ncbi:lysozyme inhibitor LprI family protein [Campylobacter sp.]|uniref:lysozyme inhibitor LprI family protein n=1 Tax=Campylobacter sp. TaxID=205 RepID=UPI00270369CA|nr:lysozyme inhibitor LprI family protein [Campylobacter sp.]
MLKKFTFIAFAASLAFGAQQLAVKNESAPNLSKSVVDESELRVQTCIDADNSTAGMIECINKEFEIQDKILNETYKKAMSILNDENKKKLKDIQRKWVAYKEAKCPFVPQGTMYIVSSANCYLKMTKERTRELKYVIEEFGANQ